MTPPMRRDVQTLFTPKVPILALAFALALATLAVVGSGCGQEGELIQTALPVQAIAWDAPQETVFTDTTSTPDALVMIANVRFKIQNLYQNGCEARGGLELRLEGPNNQPTYVISPVARYTTDEECNIGISGDTVQVINVNGVALRVPATNPVVAPSNDSIARFEVRGLGHPPFRFNVNIGVASSGDTGTGFYILVEDKDLGTPIDGANVRVERYGTPDVLGEGVTSDGGRFAFNVACTGEEGSASEPYVVKVTYLTRITIFTVIDSPALCKRREQIIVRV